MSAARPIYSSMLDHEITPAAEDGRVAPLTMHLFGPFEVRLHGRPLPRLRSRKGQWLLALLTFRHGHEVERAWLAGTLWPDSAEEAAYASLRNSLKDLRRALGPEASRLRSPTPRTLALNLEGAQVDVVAFDQGIAQGEEPAVERAISLYRGPLLEEWVEEWVLPERQAREEACLTALEMLAAAALARGDAAAAEQYLRRAVALDPLRETAQRVLMQALASGGSDAAMIQVYRELRLRLHRELNATPDPETQALYQQLRDEARGKAAHGSGLTAQGADKRRPDREPCTVSPEPSFPGGTVTFLFTDIEDEGAEGVGPAPGRQLWERQPEAMRAALEHHDSLLRQAIQAHGGLVFHSVGHAFRAAFATAPAAITAALSAQKALQTEPGPLPSPSSPSPCRGGVGPLRVRMALHTGIAEAREGNYFGPTLNRVARLLDAGHGGQILLSLPTEELVRDGLPEGASLRPLGEHRLKDLVRPEQVFQLLHLGLPATFPPLRSLAAFTHNLPIQWTSFIGREREMAELNRLLPTTPLLTLTGAGGCGKTRLALQAAADLLAAYPDGVWLVELAALPDPALVPHAVATALGVPEGAGRPLTTTLLEYFRARSLLLLLDNCEHLIQACAQLVETLLRACPAVRILATSRERLGLTGERVYLVPSLSTPGAGHPTLTPTLTRKPIEHEQGGPTPNLLMRYEAVRLFVERAVYSQPLFALTEQNAPAVAQLCQRLDGIPLALELAAARVKALPVERLAARLDDALSLLTGGSRTALPRQQTLRALIDWSYDLLTEAEQVLLRRLSVFAGGWTLEAAEAVCGEGCRGKGEGCRVPNGPARHPSPFPRHPDDVLDLLTSLVEKSLVVYEEQEGEGRYRLLESVRQYSRDRLRESGESEVVLKRHRDWFLELAEQAEPELQGPGQAVRLERLQRELDNFRAALRWSLAQGEGDSGAERSARGVQLAGALWRFFYMRGHFSEGRLWVERALAESMGITTAPRARALHGAAVLWHEQDQFTAAKGFEEESLAIRRQLADKRAIAESLDQLGHITNALGDHEEATALFEESLGLRREVGDRAGMAASLNALGYMARFFGDYERAHELCSESLRLRRDLGDQWGTAYSLEFLTQVAVEQGDNEGAVRLFEESLALRQQLGDQRGIAASLINMGHVAHNQDDWVTARSYYEQSLQIWRELNNVQGAASCLAGLASVALAQAKQERAVELYRQALALWRDTGQKEGLVRCTEGLARTALGQGRWERAVRLLGAVEAAREALGAPRQPIRRAAHESAVAAARAAVGDEAFAAAWAEGRGMTLQQAVAYALEEEARG